MAQNRIGDVSEDVILVGVLAVGGFFLAHYLGNLFGADPADVATIDTQQTLQPAADVFSYQYQPFVTLFDSGVPGTNADGTVMNMQQYFQAIRAANDAGQPVLYHDVNIAALGDALESALSAWVLATDSNAVFGVFSAIRNKMQLAGLSAYLYYNYGDDLLTKLKGSIFKVGLSPADLALLINQMNNLPAE